MDKKLLSNLKRLGVCLLLPFIAQQAMAQESTGANVTDGYYNILTNDGKYVNVAGRKTVNFVNESAANTNAGTVIRVKTNDKGQVEILRSQGVDIPGYAKRAMNYVPEIVQLVANKLNAEGTGEILGNDGLDAIMQIFNESFDYHLYLESAGSDTYRIYGKTPSMEKVVEFYKKPENKAKVDAKLPKLEKFINDAIQKVLNKTNGSGASILVEFKLETVWQKMGGTSSGLTEPKDEASISEFYSQVLSNEDNVWNFAYQTAMIYWGNLKSHPKYETDIKPKLGEYAKYIDKVENIRPNFKYYIVPGTSTLDIISQGNTKINDPSTAWKLQKCEVFNVKFPDANKRGDKYYTTLYTDFAYTLPDKVTAMKVTGISEAGVAKTEEISGKTIPAQTPILLVSTAAGDQTLAPTTSAGTAVTGNLLKGPDYLINTYKIKTAQVVTLFDYAKSIFGESLYNNYVAEYEHLMARNAGTVNNKYFFGLTDDDLNLCPSGSDDCVVRSLDVDENNKNLAFRDHWTVATNKAFLVSEDHEVIKLFLKGDINMDGEVDVIDVTTLVDYILKNNPSPCDVDACDVNENEEIDVIDVTTLVDIILNQ